MKEILKEEIKRVHQLMYGPINEVSSLFNRIGGSMDDVISNAGRGSKGTTKILDNIKNAKDFNQANTGLNQLINRANKKIKEIDDYYKPQISDIKTRLNSATSPADKEIIKKELKTLNAKIKKEKKGWEDTIAKAKENKNLLASSSQLGQRIAQLSGRNLVKFVLYLVASGAAIAGIAKVWKTIKAKNNALGCVGNWKEDSRVIINTTGAFMTIKDHDLTDDIKQKYPDGIKLIIAEKQADRKVYGVSGTSQTELGTWDSDSDCNITIKISGVDYKLFGSGQSQTQPTPTPRPRPGQGAYTNCTGTYNKGCKSPKIAQLQGCLGITPDGKWGPQTERAVRERTDRTQLIDQDIDQICGRTQPAPAPAPAPEQPTDFPLEFQ